MILDIRVITRASKTSIKKEDSLFKVHLTKPAVEGEANAQLIDLLAGYFKVKKNQVRIIHGAKSRSKRVRIGP